MQKIEKKNVKKNVSKQYAHIPDWHHVNLLK